jgi:toxin ParE1/3/4
MTLPVVFRRAARREFDEAALWYEERRPGLGAQFVLEIDRAVRLATENPQRFRSCTAIFAVFG